MTLRCRILGHRWTKWSGTWTVGGTFWQFTGRVRWCKRRRCWQTQLDHKEDQP